MNTKNMKIGILGSGIVGQTLASGFTKHGYDVMIGTRNSGKLSELKEKIESKVSVGSFTETVKFGEIVVLAVKGTAAKEILKIASEMNL